jgi:hypothetical protein
MTGLRSVFLCLASLPLFFIISVSASAQGTFEFLGDARTVPDQFSPRYGIRYNTQGFDQPDVNWAKKTLKLQRRGVPDHIISEIAAFPGSPDAFGAWVDEAFETVRNEFTACGGQLAARANAVSANPIYIRIMPTIWYEPYYQTYAAGAYYPDTNEIRVVNIYYTWGGPQDGWLRQARDLLQWEIGNYYAVQCKIQPEPRPTGWPCTAPGAK